MNPDIIYYRLDQKVRDAIKIGTQEVDEALEEMYMFIRDVVKNKEDVLMKVYYIIEYFPWAMSRGHEDEESFYDYIRFQEYPLWTIPLIVMLISGGYISITDVKRRLTPQNTDIEYFYPLLSHALEYIYLVTRAQRQ